MEVWCPDRISQANMWCLLELPPFLTAHVP